MKLIKTFDDYVGNEQTKQVLKDAITTAKKQNKQLDSIFLYGPSGVGKSTLCEVIAHEMGVHYEEMNCGILSSNSQDFTNKMMRLPDKSILFLDEAHELKIEFLEGVFYRYMDQGKLFQQYPGGMVIPMIMNNRITIIAATTEVDKLPIPFLNRFNLTIKLNNYSIEDLTTITSMNIASEGFDIDQESLTIIAKSARGVPREVHQSIRIVKNYCIANNITVIKPDLVKMALNRSGIDENGLNEIDRTYIRSLFYTFNNAPTGIKQLCNVLGENENIILTRCEPFLFKNNYIVKTSRGRMLSPLGIKLAINDL